MSRTWKKMTFGGLMVAGLAGAVAIPAVVLAGEGDSPPAPPQEIVEFDPDVVLGLSDSNGDVRGSATDGELLAHVEDAARYLSELSPRIAATGPQSEEDQELMEAAQVVTAFEVHSESDDLVGYWVGYFAEVDEYPALLAEAERLLETIED